MTLTTTEIVALTGLNEGTVRKDVEHGIAGRGSPPRFREPDVVYFAAVAAFKFHLSVEDRKALHREIVRALAERLATIDLGRGFLLEVEKVADILAKYARFETWKTARVEVDDRILGGEPVFRGSRLAVRHVGEMVRRSGRSAEVLQDYPHLSDEDVEFASLYAVAYPRLGRPREATAPR